MSDKWLDDAGDVGEQRFSRNIEGWLAKRENMDLFKLAFDGDAEALDLLPHWVAVGLLKMKATMGMRDGPEPGHASRQQCHDSA